MWGKAQRVLTMDSGNIVCICWMLACLLSNINSVTPGCEYTPSMLTCSGPNITDFLENLKVDVTEISLQNADIGTLNTSLFSRAKHLYKLHVENSGITDLVKDAFIDLKLLRTISLKGNKITSLEKGIFSNLTHLKQLRLGDNLLETVDGIFEGLVSLENLSIMDNQIEAIYEDTFKDLVKLHHLEMNNNKIKYIHPQAFRSMKMLMLLGLGENRLTSVSGLFPRNKMLQYLNLTACELSTFPNDLPSSMKFLKLTKNKIQRISRSDTKIYRHLNALILEDCGLVYIEPGSFQDMTSLSDLFMFVNQLDKVPGPFPASIKTIHLDNNKITSIPPNMFQNGTRLNVLSIRINNITSIQANAFLNIESIKDLHLERNTLTVLQDNMFKFALGLEYLNLNRLTLTAIYPDCFSNLNSLTKLEMSFVRVSKDQVHGSIFRNLPSLEELVLQESPTLAEIFITNLVIERKKVGTITKLNLEDNGLESLSSDIEIYLPNIRKLSLRGNKFHCNTNLLWLRRWHTLEPEKFYKFDHVHCFQPRYLQGVRVQDVDILQFYDPTGSHSNNSYNSVSNNVSTHIPYPDYDPVVSTPPLENYNNYGIDYENPYPYDYMDGSTIKSVSDNIPHTTDLPTSSSQPTSDKQTTLNTTNDKKQNKMSTTTTTGTENSSIKVRQNKPLKTNNGSNSSSLKTVGIAFGMAAAVIIVMLLGAFIIYKLWRKKRNSSMEIGRHQNDGGDYVFIAAQAERNGKTEPKVHRKMSRAERGSTTSRASEDITNQTDMDMKVYIMDVDA